MPPGTRRAVVKRSAEPMLASQRGKVNRVHLPAAWISVQKENSIAPELSVRTSTPVCRNIGSGGGPFFGDTRGRPPRSLALCTAPLDADRRCGLQLLLRPDGCDRQCGNSI